MVFIVEIIIWVLSCQFDIGILWMWCGCFFIVLFTVEVVSLVVRFVVWCKFSIEVS